MKLLRVGPKGQEKPAMLDAEGRARDLSAHVADIAGQTASIEMRDRLRAIDPASLPLLPEGQRIGSALADVPNFYCIGLNYARHAAETGATPPAEPVLFSKATSALSGPYDNVIIPKESPKPDWEVELGVVIGRDVEHVSEADALSCVSYYCVINDMSERHFQTERSGQWIKGKSAPTFGPTGPWLVDAALVPDPQALPLSLKLNGQTVQNSSTSDMIFSVAQIVSYMSRFMRLRTGDLISTGTPEGVGMGMKPPRWLKPGDVMEVTVEGLGVQRQQAVAYPGA